MSADDFLSNPDDKIETEPPELGPYLAKVLGSTLGKRMAADWGKPWLADQETKLQETIAELVAAANRRGLSTFNMVVTRKTGQRVVRSLDVARISKERNLQ